MTAFAKRIEIVSTRWKTFSFLIDGVEFPWEVRDIGMSATQDEIPMVVVSIPAESVMITDALKQEAVDARPGDGS